MSTNDNRQTYIQYITRKKRLKISQNYDEKIEKVINEIQDIDEEIKRLSALKTTKEKEQNQIKNEKLQAMLILYNKTGLVDEIVTMAEETTFSHTIIDDIKKKCEKGVNVDDVDLDTVEKIVCAEEAILRQVSHTNIIADLLNGLGESIEFPGEEDEGDDT